MGNGIVVPRKKDLKDVAKSIRRQFDDFSAKRVPPEKRKEELVNKYKDTIESLSPRQFSELSRQALQEADVSLQYIPSNAALESVGVSLRLPASKTEKSTCSSNEICGSRQRLGSSGNMTPPLSENDVDMEPMHPIASTNIHKATVTTQILQTELKSSSENLNPDKVTYFKTPNPEKYNINTSLPATEGQRLRLSPLQKSIANSKSTHNAGATEIGVVANTPSKSSKERKLSTSTSSDNLNHKKGKLHHHQSTRKISPSDDEHSGSESGITEESPVDKSKHGTLIKTPLHEMATVASAAASAARRGLLTRAVSDTRIIHSSRNKKVVAVKPHDTNAKKLSICVENNDGHAMNTISPKNTRNSSISSTTSSSSGKSTSEKVASQTTAARIGTLCRMNLEETIGQFGSLARASSDATIGQRSSICSTSSTASNKKGKLQSQLSLKKLSVCTEESQEAVEELNIELSEKIQAQPFLKTNEEISVNEEINLRCSICNLSFENETKKDKHMKFSTLHVHNMRKLKKNKNVEEVSYEGVEVFYDKKIFWRTRDHMDIHYFLHKNKTGKKFIEIIPYDTRRQEDLERLLVDIILVRESIGEENMKLAHDDIVLKSSATELHSLNEKDEIFGESLEELQKLCKLITERLHLVVAITSFDAKAIREVVYTPNGTDNKNIFPIVEDKVIPATVEHGKKVDQTNIIFKIESMSGKQNAPPPASPNISLLNNASVNESAMFRLHSFAL